MKLGRNTKSYTERSEKGYKQPKRNGQRCSAANIDEKDGKLLVKILNRGTEYCDGLYNYELDPDTLLG